MGISCFAIRCGKRGENPPGNANGGRRSGQPAFLPADTQETLLQGEQEEKKRSEEAGKRWGDRTGLVAEVREY